MNFALNYRIKSRTRFITFVALTLILTVVLVNTFIGSYNAASYSIRDYVSVQVESGDSLWSIAKAHMPSDMDPRHAVHKICVINDITADSIYEGQVLQIPVYE